MPVLACSTVGSLAVCWRSLESGATASIFPLWVRLCSGPLWDQRCSAGSGGCHSAGLGRGVSLVTNDVFCGPVACLFAACCIAFPIDDACAGACHSAADQLSTDVTVARSGAGFEAHARRTTA